MAKQKLKSQDTPTEAYPPAEDPVSVQATPEERCSSCRFWLQTLDRQLGTCRRQLLGAPVLGYVTPYGPRGVFPVTLATDWCGNYEVRA